MINKKLPLIGFVGIGQMGSGMAKNLINAGYSLTVYDTNPESVALLVEFGAKAANDTAQLVKSCDYVITSLPTPNVFVNVVEKHFIPNAKGGQIFIDVGTVSPSVNRRLSALLKDKGATLMDVPVTGGSGGAKRGTLILFVGGDESMVEKIRPVLEVISQPNGIIYCGPSGSGQIVKGVNQLAMGLSAAAHLESLIYGVRLGIDPSILKKAIGGDSGWRGQFSNIAENVVQGYANDVGVKLEQLPYFFGEAEENGFELPISKALYEFCKEGPKVMKEANRPSASFWNELINCNLENKD